MIPTNITTNIPSKTASQYYQERDNAFYLTQIATNYDEGDVFTIETPIVCRPLAFAITAGTKIIVNGVELEIYADAAASATQFFITATTLESPIDFASIVSINQKNLFLQYQRKTEGQIAGFDIDTDGIAKGGVEITGWLDSDTMAGATANNVPTAESVKAYVDTNAGGTSNYIMATCSTTALTSASDGIANAVVIPFDTTSVSSDTTTIKLYGAAGYESLSGTGYSFKLDTNSRTGKYHIDWNVSVDTSVVNNRYLIGITLQSMLAQEGETWEELSPSRTWIYNRGTGGNRYGSAGNSIYYNLDTDVNERIFRLVFWKEDGNASGKNITTNDGVSIKIKQL